MPQNEADIGKLLKQFKQSLEQLQKMLESDDLPDLEALEQFKNLLRELSDNFVLIKSQFEHKDSIINEKQKTIDKLTGLCNRLKKTQEDLRIGVGRKIVNQQTEINRLNEIIVNQQTEIDRLNEIIERLKAYAQPPYMKAVYLGIESVDMPTLEEIQQGLKPIYKCWLLIDTTEVVGTVPEKLSQLPKGTRVLVNSNYAVIKTVEDKSKDLNRASEAIITDILEEGTSYLINNGSGQIKQLAKIVSNISERLKANSQKLEVGDRVLFSSGYIIDFLSKAELTDTKIAIKPSTTFLDVAGLDHVLEQLKSLVLYPNKYPNLYKRLAKEVSKGILLWGPPGNGKTLVAKALSNELGKDWKVYLVAGPELSSKWVGQTEETIRKLFEIARANKPSMIIFEEADSFLALRADDSSSKIKADYVTQFSTLVDGVEPLSGVFILLTTNRKDMIDPAVTRPGRIDRHIMIPNPNREAAKAILTLYLKKLPVSDMNNCEKWSSGLVEEIFVKDPIIRAYSGLAEEELYTLSDFVSGAFLENLVERIKDRAVQRVIQLIESGVMKDEESEEKVFVEDCDLKNILSEAVESTGVVPHTLDTFNNWLIINGKLPVAKWKLYLRGGKMIKSKDTGSRGRK